MTGRDKPGTAPADGGTPNKPLPPLPKTDDDDYEDGDIATPKKDRDGNDPPYDSPKIWHRLPLPAGPAGACPGGRRT